MDTAVYWIWLQRALGVGAHQSEAVLRHFESAKAVYDAREIPQSLLLTAAQHRRLADRDLTAAENEYQKLCSIGAWLLTPEDGLYHSLFEGMYAPPVVLYAKGERLSRDDAPAVAIVGTRYHDEAGRAATRKLAAGLAAGGAIIVSGGAEGLDSEALDAALNENGVCLSFQACGIDVEYPHAVAPLRQRLLESGGLLLSEFPLGLPALRHHFRIRNRLISAAANGTLVTQAPHGSGALITAGWARDQGKDVYAVPGAVGVACCEGSNELLKDGARLVTNAADILMEYVERYPTAIDIAAAAEAERRALRPHPVTALRHPVRMAAESPAAEQPLAQVAEHEPCPADADPDMKRIYAVLEREAKTVTELARELGMTPPDVLAALTELELYGTVSCQAGQRYALCPKG